MNELVLTTIGNILNEQLSNIFSGHGINIIERKNKQSETQEFLFYCSPETYLTALSSDSDSKSSVDLLDIWMEETEKQLTYIIANPEGCWLIDLDYVVTNPNKFICFANESLDIDLTECVLPSSDIFSLAKQCVMLVENDVAQGVYEDIVAAADYFEQADNFAASERIQKYLSYLQVEKKRASKAEIERDELKILSGKLQLAQDDVLNENQQMALQVSQLEKENDSFKSENELTLLQIAQLQQELEASFLNSESLKSDNEHLTSENNQRKKESDNLGLEKNKLQKEVEEIKSENELALLQIAQLQEELEVSFLNNTSLKSDNEHLTSENNQRKKELDNLGLEKDKLQKEVEEIKSENELALLQIAQLQEELEKTFLDNTSLKNGNEHLTSEKSQYKKELDNLGLEKEKLQKEVEEIKSENELALLQIAQLQEELEFYFMKSQNDNSVDFTIGIKHLNISTLKQSLQLLKLVSNQ